MSYDSTRPFILGAADHRRHEGRRFGIRPSDLLRHVWILGKTGMGKSALLEQFILEHLHAGAGVALVDPHGDLAERVLDRVPSRRVNDVVYLDAADLDRPMGWNLLEHAHPRERALVASGVLGIFRKVFAESWGPRLEHVFRMTLLALLEVRDSTLLGVVRMLADDGYRARVVARVSDPLVRFYWTREFPAYGATFAAEVVAPVQNKVAAVLTTPALRLMFGQPRSTVTAREMMAEGRIFIANLAKGRLGDDASALLGAVIVTSFQLATYARAAMPLHARRPYTLVIDEFASFATRSFQEILTESRKYRLGLVIAHQYLAQLDHDLHAAVQGNAGTIITFRLGADDAEALAPEFTPELDARDLARLAPYQIALKLAVDGVTSRPFTATTLPPCESAEGHAATIRRVSAERYGHPRAEVDAYIATALDVGPSSSRSRSTPGA